MSDTALDPSRNVFVAASAGTGKTWLLTARIVRLLLDGHRADGILALTFTRKAAAEMRERVQARLRDLALADDAALAAQLAQIGVSATAEHVARARSLYETLLFSPWPLRASTIHAFCQDLVSRFALQCGLAPGAELVENEQALIDAAWQSAQAELLAQPDAPPAQALRMLIAEGCSESQIRALVSGFLALRNDWRAYAQGRDDALQRLEERLARKLRLDRPDPADAVGALPIAELYELLRACGGTQYVKLERFAPALDAQGSARVAALAAALLKQDGQPYSFKFGKAQQKILSEAQIERALYLHAQLTDAVLAAREYALAQATQRRTHAGCTLGLLTLHHFDALLRTRNLLPFAELEWHACRLLADPATGDWVQYKLDQRIDHLLVDEFQDTSNTQWSLLLPLLREMAAGGERERSAFFVGDIKQSIYGFRRANPELMPLAEQWLAQTLAGTRVELSASRRSAPPVIAFVNAVFAQPELALRLHDFPQHSTVLGDDWGRVELAPPIEDEPGDATSQAAFRNPLTTPRQDVENTRALREGRVIAKRIRELVDQRVFTYGEIMILLRWRTHQQALERALTEDNIPFTGAARGTLLDTVEARDLCALLRFLDAPERDLDLVHALRSPLFAASDADLVQLAAAARAHRTSWYDALLVSDLLPLARELLPSWLIDAQRLPAHDLLDRICSQGNAAARYEAALPTVQGARVRGNLDALLQLALEADSGRYPSLSKFLRELEQARGGDAPDEAPPPSSGGQVRILTIHAAKGLEAPAVFLAQTASAGGRRDVGGWRVDWPQGDDRPQALLLTGNRDTHDAYTRALSSEREERQAREDAHLLYVALTRARRFLHISGYLPKRASKEASWYTLAAQAYQSQPAAFGSNGALPATITVSPAESAQDMDARLLQPIPVAASSARVPSALEGQEPDRAAARRGDAIHLLLQKLAAGLPRTRLRALLPDAGEREFDEWLAEAQRVITAPALQHFYAEARRAWNEVPLLDGDSAGVIDRLVDDGESIWVLDYKTQRVADDAALLALYRPQLAAYRAGVRRLWPGRAVRAGLVLTAQARWLECVFGD